MPADSTASRDVRLVAAQRVPADAIDTLSPAALNENGRLIAFVSRHRWDVGAKLLPERLRARPVDGAHHTGECWIGRHRRGWGQPGSESQLGRAGYRVRDHRVEAAIGWEARRTPAGRRPESPEWHPAIAPSHGRRAAERRYRRSLRECGRSRCRIHVRRAQPGAWSGREWWADRHFSMASRHSTVTRVSVDNSGRQPTGRRRSLAEHQP